MSLGPVLVGVLRAGLASAVLGAPVLGAPVLGAPQRPAGADARSDASESVYARWSLGPPTDPAWFPIGVWLQEPRLAPRYAALGVNTYVGLWKGPTEEQLELLADAGMKVVCGLNAVGRAHRDDPSIVAWMQTDEPENKSSERAGPRATVEEATERYRRLRAFDPDRPVWMNLGQGVANDAWRGMGAPRSDYPAYVAATDIVSFDVYPITNIRRDDGENWLWYVAEGVRRLREWGNDRNVVWNVVETTRGPHPTKKPTPEQVRAEVWLSLIAGSRGIVYFCHEFEPDVSAAALLLDEEMCAALTKINLEILDLAPILNGPTLEGRVRATSARPRIEIATMLKEHDGALWLFAIAERNGPTRARLELDLPERYADATEVDVLGEDRTLPLADGVLRDAFGAYERHVYVLRGSDER